jgi:hypothetical protein
MKLPHRRQFLHLAAGAAALPTVSRLAWAQAYPTRPDGCHRSRPGRAHAGAARPTDHHGKCDGRGRSLGVGRRLQEFLDRDSAVEAGSPTTTDFLWQEHLTAMEG